MQYSTDIIENEEENKYLDMLQHILTNGIQKIDRTGIGTLSIFGHSLRFNLTNSFPLLTTKKIWLKGIFHELQWILSGSTNNKVLQEKKVHIWDLNSTREFLDSRNLEHYPEGDIGATYGDRVLPILYVNGVSKGNATESGTPGSSDVPVLMNAQMHIGVQAGGARDFTGRHRQYSFWNRLLTSSEVTSLYNSGTPVGGASVQSEDLIADLPFYSQQDKSRNRFSLRRYNSFSF